MIRIALILILPVAIAWAVFSRLFREIRSAFNSAWLDACLEVASARRLWRELDDSKSKNQP
jgi:hypothetical protein